MGRPIGSKPYRRKQLSAFGYIEFRQSTRRWLAHRVVMELVIGRKLTRDEIVHHKNGNKLDNRPDNLEITTRSEHRTKHAKNVPCKLCNRPAAKRYLCEMHYQRVKKARTFNAHPVMRGHVERIALSEETVSYTHLRAHETPEHLVCRLL